MTAIPDLKGRTVWVVDTLSRIYQLFHALPEMTSPQGEPVSAVYGFARDLIDIITSRQPDYLFCGMDAPGPTFAMRPMRPTRQPAVRCPPTSCRRSHSCGDSSM